MLNLQQALQWAENAEYDKFYPLNDSQRKLLKEIKIDPKTSLYTFDFNNSGVRKRDNEDNKDNYQEVKINEWNFSVKSFVTKTIRAPKQAWLAEIISRTNPEKGIILKEKAEKIRLNRLRQKTHLKTK